MPHIGSLLSPSLQEVADASEVVVIASSAANKPMVGPRVRPDHMVIDRQICRGRNRLTGQVLMKACAGGFETPEYIGYI